MIPLRTYGEASLVLLAFLLLGQTMPSVPSSVTYQGKIEEGEEQFPDGEYEMTFLLFDAQTGGNLLWSETQPGVSVDKGLYKVALGGGG